jgi:uncharacterized protein
MRIHELTPEECTEVLNRVHLGRLACSRSDQPYVVPIHFSFDAERQCVYSFASIGQKVRWMRENPKVCLEIDEIVNKNQWTSVVVIGRYEEISDAPNEADARRRAEQLFRQRVEWWFPAAAKVSSTERQDIVVYRIQIERMSGRRT